MTDREKAVMGYETILDEEDSDDETATTAALTELTEVLSDDDSDDDDEDFAAENLPRDPPIELLYGGRGTSTFEERAGRDERPGRSTKTRGGRTCEADPPTTSEGALPMASAPAAQSIACVHEPPMACVPAEPEPPAACAPTDLPRACAPAAQPIACVHEPSEACVPTEPELPTACAPEDLPTACVPAAPPTACAPAEPPTACVPEDPTKATGDALRAHARRDANEGDHAPSHWTRINAAGERDDNVVNARRRLAEEIMGEAATKPMSIRGLVAPRWRAQQHPAAALLREYARRGCPVDVGPEWTLEQLEAAVERGPHTSALEPDAIKQIQVEAREKAAQGFATIYKWEDLRKNLPRLLKLSPLAMIPHKSRKYRAILDLSFALMVDGYQLPSVNDATRDTAPEEAINQIGTVLPRIIEAFANAPPGEHFHLMKLDIKDGFWRMVCEEGQEWNFAYVLPNDPGEPVEIVVPSALQMGWALSPPFFCAASETARDVAASYVHETLGALPPHPLEAMTMPTDDDLKFVLPDLSQAAGKDSASFLHLLEVYVDDFIQIVQSNDPNVLRHCSRAVLHAIHSVFPPPAITGHNGEDPISIKKLKELEGLWEVRKEILGWVFDGATRCIELSATKQKAILAELKTVLRIKNGVPFKRVEKLTGKLRHAAIGIPGGKGLFGPINKLLAVKPSRVFWDRCPAARQALDDWRQLLRAAAKEPTHTRELVPGEPDFVGALDASGEGAGGVWLPGATALDPVVWRFKWPQEIVDRLVTFDNPAGDITNSDLEMAAEVLGWLVLEAIVKSLRWKHVGVWSDNTPTVAWTMRWASKRSAAANRLLRILAIRHRENRASPLVARHIAGELNHLGDIPSRSFGYRVEWHFELDNDFLTFFNSKFPLPDKSCWTGFRLENALATKVTRELLTEGSSMAGWRRLARRGRKYGESGRTTAMTSKYLRTWIRSTSATLPVSRPCSGGASGKVSAEGLSALGTFAPASGTSTRRSPWTRAASPSTSATGNTT